MKVNSILIRVCVIAVLVGHVCGEESGEVGLGEVGLGNGVNIRIVTKAEPPSKNTETLKLSNRYAVSKGILHRSIIDAANLTYFGYDLYAEPLVGATQCRIAILPLTSVETANSPRPGSHASTSATSGGNKPVQVDSSYRPVLLPRYPDPQVVTNGTTIALDLLISADGQEKLIDYIEVSCKPPTDPPVSAAARDFSLEDVEMHMASPSISINGSPVAVKAVDVRGSLIWFYVPGRGRFILSAAPRRRQNFVQSGLIHGPVVSFQVGKDEYEVRSRAAVLGSGQTWHLYILYDPSFEPKHGVTFGSAARFDELFSNR